MPGKLIVFEGGDGSGKTTLSKNYAAHIGADWQYEPYGQTEVTKTLRHICLDLAFKEELSDCFAREYLMFANRSISLKDIKKKLDAGKDVVCDRSFVSGMVYAKVAADTSFEEWHALGKRAITVFPDKIIHVTSNRMKLKKGNNDIYDTETDSFHERIRVTFSEALAFTSDKFGIQVLNFQNDMNLSSEENLNKLLELLALG